MQNSWRAVCPRFSVTILTSRHCFNVCSRRFSARHSLLCCPHQSTLLSRDSLIVWPTWSQRQSERTEPSESASVKPREEQVVSWKTMTKLWVWVYQPICKGQLPGRTVRTAESVKIQGDSNSVISLSDEVTGCVMHNSAGLALMSAGRVAWAAPLSGRQSVSSSSL